MSEYEHYLSERQKIDAYLNQGFVIAEVTENLSGAFVKFIHNNTRETATIHVGTADARKYFSAVVLMQQKAK